MKLFGRHIQDQQKGFTILLSALVASLVLTLGIAVFSVAQKQVVLSSLGRSSQYAFYAADTGVECALYWDMRHQYFGTTTPAAITNPACNEKPICTPGSACDQSRLPAPPYTMSFQYETNGFCVDVIVTKSDVDPKTTLHADGYSTACSEISSSGRTLQRSVELSY